MPVPREAERPEPDRHRAPAQGRHAAQAARAAGLSFAVTTSGKTDGALIARAKGASQRWGIPFVARRRKEPLNLRGDDARLVFGRQGVALWDALGKLPWSLGMAALRIKRIDAGLQDDTLVRAAELAPADRVLDCTLGLAQDALVAAHVVGPRGKVVGLEKSLPLCALVGEGLLGHPVIEVRHADAALVLPTLLPKSFDVVLLDPMFARKRASSGSFEALRRYADHAPLTRTLVTQARRVARRWVVVKGSRYSDDLTKLGLTALPGSRFATVQWARL